MAHWFNGWIERLLEFTGLSGMMIVLVTVPLAILQGFLGIFPFSTLIFLHISALGLIDGLIVSWAVGTLAAIFVYMFCKFLFAERFRHKWGNKLQRYEKWQNYFEQYGIWGIILLRTIPVMPNNLISFMSAISPIKTSSYLWSSVIGNLSHIWLFGIVSSSILFPGMDIWLLIGTYAMFCAGLFGMFMLSRFWGNRRRNKDERLDEPLIEGPPQIKSGI